MVTCTRLCKRCLRNHQSDCTQREGCRVCGGNHHTFLHLERQEDRNSLSAPVHESNQEINQQEGNEQSSAIIKSHHVSLQRSIPNLASHHVNTKITPVENNQIERYVISWDAPILLATAIILIRSVKNNMFYPFRALLDQGGETSHISESAAKTLGLNKKPISAMMSGLGGISTGSANSVVEFEIGSKINQLFTMNVQAVVVPKVTNPLPSTFIPKTDWKYIEGLRLADPEFCKPANIDVLLGAPVYGYLLLPGLIKGTPDSPVAQNTELGWILSGATQSTSLNFDNELS